MNIAHCIHGLGLGGAQQIIKLIVRGRTSEQLRYWVYSCEDGVFREEIESAGAMVRIIPRRLPKFDPFWVRSLSAAMRSDGIDIVHTHLFGDSLHGYLAARAAGDLPVVMTLHVNAQTLPLLHRLGYRWLLSRNSRNVACSDSVRHSFESEALRTGASVETVANGVDPRTAATLNPGEVGLIKRSLGVDVDAPLVATVGRLVKEKGLPHVIRAFARLCSGVGTDARLVFVGDGPLRADLQRRAQRHGISDRVAFAGYRADISRLLPTFDVFVLNSTSEAMPIALLEAMAAGRCIVAADAPGILDAVTPGREALVVRRGDVSGLSAALEQVIADPALRRRLGAAAQQRFLRDFTADRMVAQYEAIYREVCGAPGPKKESLAETARGAGCSRPRRRA